MKRFIIVVLSVFTLTTMACSGQQVSTAMEPEETPSAGELVDWRHLGRVTVPGHLTEQADIYQFSYVTESDVRQIATGRMAIPAVRAGTTYDLVAHLHGTIGFADHCAPSRMPGFGFESPVNPIAGDMVAAGRVVVMPDYPGLGGPGRHRYVERDATGRSVWDALAASRVLVATVQPTSKTSNRVALVGHSQGGHATLATLATQRPEDPFDVVAAVALAPPGDPAQHARLVADGEARAAPLAWGLMSYARAYPEMEAERWLRRDVARELPVMMEERCAPKLTLWLGWDPADIFTPAALDAFRSGETPPGLEAVLEQENFDDLRSDTDILVYHGTDDDLLPPVLSRKLVERLRENGNDVERRVIDGAGHLSVPRRARADVVDWIDARMQ